MAWHGMARQVLLHHIGSVQRETTVTHLPMVLEQESGEKMAKKWQGSAYVWDPDTDISTRTTRRGRAVVLPALLRGRHLHSTPREERWNRNRNRQRDSRRYTEARAKPTTTIIFFFNIHEVRARANQATAEPTTTRTAHSHTTHDVQATLRVQCPEG